MNSELFLERRRLIKKCFSYRAMTVVLALGLTGLLLSKTNEKIQELNFIDDCIVKIIIDGGISPEKMDVSKIDNLIEQDKIKAIIVEVNSPGGESAHSERIYSSIRKLSEKKPVVTKMMSVACSGGFMIAMAGDYIFASNTTMTGSIGVVLPTFNFTGVIEKIGIESKVLRSGSVKYFPNRFEKISPEAEETLQEALVSTHNFFKELVSSRRNIPLEDLEILADGRIYTGRQAKELKLIDDTYGTETEIKDWLVKHKGIDKALEIKNVDISIPDSISRMPIKFLVDTALGYLGINF